MTAASGSSSPPPIPGSPPNIVSTPQGSPVKPVANHVVDAQRPKMLIQKPATAPVGSAAPAAPLADKSKKTADGSKKADVKKTDKKTTDVAAAVVKSKEPAKPAALAAASPHATAEVTAGAERANRKKAFDAAAAKLTAATAEDPLAPHRGDFEGAVYMTPKLVFKPGVPAAVKNSTCYQIAELAGLHDAVPITIAGKASIALDPDKDCHVLVVDKDLKLVPKKSLVVPANDEELPADAVVITKNPPKAGEPPSFTMKEGNHKVTLKFSPDGKTCQMERTDLAKTPSPAGSASPVSDEELDVEDEAPRYVIARDPTISTQYYLIPVNANRLEIATPTEQVEITVQVDDVDDEVDDDAVASDSDDDGDQKVKKAAKPKTEQVDVDVLEAVPGMVQERVGDLDEAHSKGLSLDAVSPAREAFLQRVDFDGFVDAFGVTILVAPQDGKASDLSESNFLFKKMKPKEVASPLRPVAIDLNETLPPANDYSREHNTGAALNANAQKQVQENIHAVRNGLMGFPQVQQPLTGAALAKVKVKLAHMVAQRAKYAAMDVTSNPAHFGPTHRDALLQRIDRVEAFLKAKGTAEGWTLQELFFSVFPEYSEQWKSFQKIEALSLATYMKNAKSGKTEADYLKNVAPVIAAYVGHISPAKLAADFKAGLRPPVFWPTS